MIKKDGRANNKGSIKKGQYRPSPRNTKMPVADRMLLDVTKTNAQMIVGKYANVTYEELKELLDKKNQLPCLELLVIRAMESAIAKGDLQKLNWFSTILWGRPREQVVEKKTISFNYALNQHEEHTVTERDIKQEIE